MHHVYVWSSSPDCSEDADAFAFDSADASAPKFLFQKELKLFNALHDAYLEFSFAVRQ